MVAMTSPWVLTALSLALLRLANAQSITSCPVAETTGTTNNGYTYRICPGTDYQGQSDQMIQNIASTKACSQLCANDVTCVKAVYDTAGSICHFKTTQGALTWVKDKRFDTVRLDTVAGRSVINKCPYTESVYTAANGVKYQVCGGTDYEGGSLQIIQNVASVAACNKICEQTPGCTKTVYDLPGSVCHIKDDQGNLVWATNRRFVTSRIPKTWAAGTYGKWTDIIKLPVIPVAGYVVPQQPDSSKIMFFSSFQPTNFGGPHGYTAFGDYNFKTGATSQRTVSNTNHDMFCPGISSLQDGRILITGGSDAAVTSLYNPSSNSFSRGPDMKIARGYQTSVTLSNGNVFTVGGSYSGGIGGKTGEVYNPTTNAWTLLDGADVTPMLTTYDAEGDWRRDNHGWLFGWRDGTVFQAGPSKTMHWYGTSGSGSVADAGTRDADNDAMCAMVVMYDVGKIFAAGGTQSYTNSPAFTKAFGITIGAPNTPATVERLPDMSYARAFGNAVVLPDGTVLLTGGQNTARVFTDTEAVLVPELFDPATKTFTRLAPAAIPRNYHAISILLPDGTVFTGGGGLCYNPNGDPNAGCDRSADHADGEIFSPRYLFNADGSAATRPIISSMSSTSATNGYKVRVGGSLSVRMSNSSGVTFSLVRLGSVTHSVNSDQRRVPLSDVKQSTTTFTLKLPSDSGILIPGYYYLFAISKTGVPSMAKTVQVTL